MTQHVADLVLVLHNHQPYGNFGHVFEQAYDRCYRPVLDLLGEFPAVRWALLDGSHLLGAGLMPRPGGELQGYYVTEKVGLPLAVFPISKALRYAIPFQEVEPALESMVQAAIKTRRPGGPPPVLTY